MGRYEIQLTNAQWHTEGVPAHDGEFWTILGYGEQKEISTINYTVKHGWNTSRLMNTGFKVSFGELVTFGVCYLFITDTAPRAPA